MPQQVNAIDINAVPVQRLRDLDVLSFGNTIQLVGAIWAGEDQVFLASFPEEDLHDGPMKALLMDGADWERLLQQTDVVDVQGPGKAILRKSQRQIDQNISWRVFRRDDYACRYCGRNDVPLTVDHIILWEQGGATVEENLVSACRRCNKLRGNTEYDVWIRTGYLQVSKNLGVEPHNENVRLLHRLEDLRKITAKPRSR